MPTLPSKANNGISHVLPFRPWANDPDFGHVHRSGCNVCLDYMNHITATKISGNDFSFQNLMEDRHTENSFHFFEGVRQGRCRQRDHDQRQLEQLKDYRSERDEAREQLIHCNAQLSDVREELSSMKNSFHLLQCIFETTSRLDTRCLDALSYQALLLNAVRMARKILGLSKTDIDTSVKEFKDITSDRDEGDSSESDVSDLSGLSTLGNICPPPHSSYILALNSEQSSGSSSSPDTSDLDSSSDDDDDIMFPKRNSKRMAEVQALMEAAHQPGNDTALAQVKLLCSRAHLKPREERTDTDRFLLSNWRCPSPPRAEPRPLDAKHVEPEIKHDVVQIFVDASSWGVGFVMDKQWLAWRLKAGWKTLHKDNNWTEMVAVELGLRSVIASGRMSSLIIVRSDNYGVVQSLQTRISKNFHQNIILQKILSLVQEHSLRIAPMWISTKDNPADDPSRGVFSSRSLLFPSPPQLPQHLEEFLYPPEFCNAIPVS